MKLSVIIGVLHMSMGVVIKGMNAVYFRRYEDLVFEVITGLIILLGLFGWMDFLIFAKWFHHIDIYDTTPYTGPHASPTEVPNDSKDPTEQFIPETNGQHDNRKTPSVINIMIDTVFNAG